MNTIIAEGAAHRAAPPPAGTRGQRILFALACVLCTLPLWVGHYPPLVDIPQHAAQIAAIKGMLDGGWPFADLFEIRWFTPYWLGYGLVLVMSYVFGILLSLKLVLAVSMAALPWTAARFCRKAGIDAAWTWLLLAMPFGFAYQWGFLSFLVAMPLAFLFLASALDLRERQDGRIWLKLALGVNALFFAHALIAAFACVVAALMLVSPWRGPAVWLRRITPLFAVLPVAALWLALVSSDSAQAHAPVQWNLQLPVRLQHFLPRMIGAPDAFSGNLLGLTIVALPFLAGGRPSGNPARWLPFAFYAGFMLLFPVYAMGNAYTAQRFAVFGLPLYLLCFGPAAPATRRRFSPTLIALPAVCIAALLFGWHTLRASTNHLLSRGYSEVIAHAEPGKRLLSLMVDAGSPASTAPVFIHFPAWYQAEHGGLTELSFARSYAIPVRFRRADASAINMGFEWNPQAFDWQSHHGERYDYFLIRHPRDPGKWLMAKSGCRVRLASHSGSWWLYQRAPKPASCLAAD